MRLTQVELKNWLVHRHLQLSLQPLALVCGPNETGKSSISDAISFAVLRRLPRIHLEGDRDMLVTQGAKAGEVSIVCEADGKSARLTRNILDAKLRTEAHLPVPDTIVSDAADYVFDPPAFALASTDERLKLMLKVGRVQMAPAHLKDLLIRKGFPLAGELSDEENCEQWFKYCDGMAHEARGQWKEVTATAYGAVKAETWSAPVEEISTGALAQAEAGATNARMKLLELTGQLGKHAGQHEGEHNRLTMLAGGLERDIAHLEKLQGERKRALEIEGQLTTEMRAMRNRPLVCVKCGTRHALAGNELVAISDDGTDLGPVASPADLLNAQNTLARARETVSHLTAEVERWRRAVADAEEARATLAAWLEEPESAAITQVRAEIETQENLRQDCEAQVIALRATIAANERAVAKTGRAKEYHKTVQDWLALRAQVAPDGLPAKLLTDALAGFNALLATLATALGWPAFAIGADMQITRAGMPYELLSESAQWRVDAMMAIALAEASGFRMVVLDRLDVLGSLGMRPALIGFYRLIKSGRFVDSILLLGTMARAPVVPADVTVHWLGTEPAQHEAAA